MTALVILLLLQLVTLQINVEAQQAPAFVIPEFTDDPGLRARQDVCDRFRAYDRSEVELRYALSGLEIRPLFTSESFFHLDENGKLDEDYPGMMPLIMDELAERAGFTWRDSFGVTNGPPKGSNKTWTDLLLWGTDYYDVYCDWYSKTLQRLQLGVTFPHGFYDGSIITVAAEASSGDSSIDLWQWLEPFDAEVWYLIIVTVILSGVVYQILDHVPPRHADRHHTTYTHDGLRRGGINTDDSTLQNRSTDAEDLNNGANTFEDNIFLSSLLFTQHFQFMPRTSASRVFSTSLGLWALLISSNYTANLASFFVVENTPKVAVTTIQDAVTTGQSICVWKGTSSHDWVKRVYPRAKLVEIENTETELLNAVRTGECVLGITTAYSFERLEILRESNPDCNLHWVGRTLQTVQNGFATKADAGGLCTSLVHDVLNTHLMEMESEGVLKELWRRELERSQTKDCSQKFGSGDVDNNSRSLKEMAGTFVLHLIISVISVLISICSRLRDKFKRTPAEERSAAFGTETLSKLFQSKRTDREDEASVHSDQGQSSKPTKDSQKDEGDEREVACTNETSVPRQPKSTPVEVRLENVENRLEMMQNGLEMMQNGLEMVLKHLERQSRESSTELEHA